MYDKVPQLDVKGYKVVMNLEESATYYYIKNTDFLLAMPSLEPMVYIGKEIMGGSELAAYHFQDTISYIKFGVLCEGDSDAEDVETIAMPENGVHSSSLRL